jgi:uncharacterized damage-inducible protein DinB
MPQIQKWFDRSFELSFPVELYPNLNARLRGTPARVEELLRTSSPAASIRKPNAHWSAQEHAGHLLDLEELWLARTHDFLLHKNELTPADLRNRKTHDANHNARPAAEILSAFRAARGQLLDTIRDIEPAAFSQTLLHPRLKTPMRLVDHLYFIAEHDDHHLAVIWELLTA